MENVYLIIGFVVLGIIIYVAYLATNTKASQNTPETTVPQSGEVKNDTFPKMDQSALNLSEPSIQSFKFPVIKQRFNVLGWVGVVLLFICPFLTGLVINSHLSSLSSNYYYDAHNYSVLYVALGLAEILAFVFVIIGREFYSEPRK